MNYIQERNRMWQRIFIALLNRHKGDPIANAHIIADQADAIIKQWEQRFG